MLRIHTEPQRSYVVLKNISGRRSKIVTTANTLKTAHRLCAHSAQYRSESELLFQLMDSLRHARSGDVFLINACSEPLADELRAWCRTRCVDYYYCASLAVFGLMVR